MSIQIREYTEKDQADLIRCMEGLQDYLIDIDPLSRIIRPPEYGESYTTSLLDKVKENEGIIYVAESDIRIVGCVVGILEKLSLSDSIGVIPSKSARVIELYVDSKCRGQGIGLSLMNKMESYFKAHDCDVVRIEVFAPNVGAHNFYKSNGYVDRDITLFKKI